MEKQRFYIVREHLKIDRVKMGGIWYLVKWFSSSTSAWWIHNSTFEYGMERVIAIEIYDYINPFLEGTYIRKGYQIMEIVNNEYREYSKSI